MLFLGLSFVGGCQYHKKTFKPAVPSVDTVVVFDTVEHHIIDHFPYYITNTDSVIIRDTVIQSVDTAAILKDYFAIHYYTRVWEDTLVKVTIEDAISENRSISSNFKYNLLKPQTIINNSVDNSVTYNKYAYFGVFMPVFPFKVNEISNINYVGLEALMAYPKGYSRVSWQPYTKTFIFGTGVTIMKFKR